MDDCEELIPNWLGFIHGVIDSEHLDLNVSREILQKSKVIQKMRKIVTKKIIELLLEMSEDEEKLEKLLKEFGKNIKQGIYEEEEHRESLSSLMRFNSTKKAKVSLDGYIEGYDKELEEKGIYYISAENKTAAENSPFLEGYKKANIEVLYLTETIDEYVSGQLKAYKGFILKNITKSDVSVPGKKEDKEENSEEEKKFIEAVKKSLDKEVEDVVKVTYLTNTPASVSSSNAGYTANMERIMKSQALGSDMMSQFMMGKRIMGINMKHSIIEKLRETDFESDNFKNTIKTIFYLACLSCGYSLEDKSKFLAQNVYNMMAKEMKVELQIEDENTPQEANEEKEVTEID